MRSELELAMEHHLRVLYLSNDNWPEAHVEYRFIVDRFFRFDFAFLDIKLAVECEGGVYSKGRHVRGAGFEKDCEKYNLAAEFGWTVLRYTKKMIDSGEAINQIERIVKERYERRS